MTAVAFDVVGAIAVELVLNRQKFDRSLAELRDLKFNDLAVKIRVDTREVETQLRRVQELAAKPITIELKFNTTQIQQLQRELGSVAQSKPIQQAAPQRQQAVTANTTETGKNIAQGLATGAESESQSVSSAFGRIGKRIQDQIKSIFEISSPSRWAIRIGESIAQGLQIGLQSVQTESLRGKLQDIKGDFERAAKGISDELKRYPFQAEGGLDIAERPKTQLARLQKVANANDLDVQLSRGRSFGQSVVVTDLKTGEGQAFKSLKEAAPSVLESARMDIEQRQLRQQRSQLFPTPERIRAAREAEAKRSLAGQFESILREPLPSIRYPDSPELIPGTFRPIPPSPQESAFRRASRVALQNPATGPLPTIKPLEAAVQQATPGLEQFKRTVSTPFNARGFQEALDGLKARFEKLPQFVQGAVGAIAGFGVGNVAISAIQGITNALQGFVKGSVDAFVNLDRLKTGLNFAVGGSAKAGQDLEFVRSTVDKLGIPLDVAQQGFVKLAAATRGTATEGKATRDLFLGISQATTVLGLSASDANGVLLALSQVASKGKLSAEELRLQLGERLPGAVSIAARALNVTESELNKLLETGSIMSSDFLPKFGKQLQIEFGGSAETASKNLQSSFFRLAAANQKLQESFGQAISPAVKGGVDALAGALGFLAANMDKILQVVAVFGTAMAISLGGGALKAVSSLGLVQNVIAGIASLGAGGFTGLLTAFQGITFSLEGASVAAGKLAIGLRSILGAAAPVLVAFAAFETLRTFGEIFGVTEATKEFDNFAKGAEESLKRIGVAADEAASKVKDVKPIPSGPAKGFDLTLGLGGLTGLAPEGIKTDTVLNALNNSDFVRRGNRAAGIGDETGRLTTISDLQQQKEVIAANNARDQVGRLSSQVFSGRLTTSDGGSIGIRDSLLQEAKLDRSLQSLRADRARLAATKTATPGELKQKDEEIRLQELERGKISAPVEAVRGTLQTQLNFAKSQIENIDLQAQKEGGLTAAAGERRKVLAGIASEAERSLKAMDGFGKGIQTSSTIASKLAADFVDIADRIESAKASAALLSGQNQLATQRTDPLAAQRSAVQRAQAERQSVELETRNLRQKFASPEGSEALAAISVGTTGRTLTRESSIADIKTAKAGLAEKDPRRQVVDSLAQLRQLEQQQVDTGLAESQAREALAGAELDRNAKQREDRLRQTDNTARARLAQQQQRGRLPETEVAVRGAQIGLESTSNQIAAAEKSLEEVKSKAGLNAAERIKREEDLTNRLSDLKRQKAEQELALQDAINKKIIDNLQRANRLAEASIQRTTTERITSLRQFGLQPGAGELTDAAISRAGAAEDTGAIAQRISLKERELTQNKQLLQQGTITAREAQDNEIRLQQELADLNQQRVDRSIESEKQLRDARLRYAQEAFDAQQASIGREIELLNARNELAQARSASGISGLEGRARVADRALGLAGRLKTEQDPGVRGEIARQLQESGLGFDEKAILQEKFRLENEIAARKENASRIEYEYQLKILDLELQKNLAAAEREQREAARAQLDAQRSEKVAAQELQQAQKGGNKEQIDIAKDGIEIAKQDKAIADLQVRNAAANVQQVKSLAQVQKEVLGVKRAQTVEDERQTALAREQEQRLAAAEQRAARGGAGEGISVSTGPRRFQTGEQFQNAQDANRQVTDLIDRFVDKATGITKAGDLVAAAAQNLASGPNQGSSTVSVSASGGTQFKSEFAGRLAEVLSPQLGNLAFDLAEALKKGRISTSQISGIQSGAKTDEEMLAALRELIASIRQNSDAQDRSRAQALAGIGNLPAFETGGMVGAHLTDKPILVGEKGPEIFFPGGPGYVMPHDLARFLMDPGMKRYETGGLVGGAIMPIVPDVSPAKVEPSAAPNNAMDRLSSEFAQHVNRLATAAEKLTNMPAGQNNSFTLVNESDPIDSILRLQHGLMRTQYGV